jgi:hypothetical protein
MTFEEWLISKGIQYWYIDDEIHLDEADLIPFVKELLYLFPEFKFSENVN